MSLDNPKIDYLTIRDELLTFLRANLTALNVGLDTKFTVASTQIKKGYINQTPTFMTDYPIILVDTVSEDEEPLTMGLRKLATIYLNVYGVVYEISEGGYDDNDEAVNLMSNIQGLLRDNVTFSSANIMYTRIPSTNFKLNEIVGANDEGVYVAGGILNLEVQVEVI